MTERFHNHIHPNHKNIEILLPSPDMNILSFAYSAVTKVARCYKSSVVRHKEIEGKKGVS